MNIHIADHYGLCFGVRDAIKEAERLTDAGPLTILGELVHNPVVRERFAQRGVKEGNLFAIGTAETPQVMITAHGASNAARAAWRAAGYGVADGTCPLVRHAHDQLRVLVTMGCFPIVIGQVGHVEVRGLVGDFPNAVVVHTEADFVRIPDAPRYGIISQTTQPIDHVKRVVSLLRERFPEREIIFRDTVCQPTKNRQAALQTLIGRCDTIVIVGGRNSNNTLALVAAVRGAGRKAVHVTQAMELQSDWVKNSHEVGVTAGTSTLKETVSAVIERLVDFGGVLHSPSQRNHLPA